MHLEIFLLAKGGKHADWQFHSIWISWNSGKEAKMAKCVAYKVDSNGWTTTDFEIKIFLTY